MPSLNWNELGVSELLPTGTVTLLLADVEGSTRLWETQAEQMSAALARLNKTVNDAVDAHDGVRPLEQGEGDSFVAAFARRQARHLLGGGALHGSALHMIASRLPPGLWLGPESRP